MRGMVLTKFRIQGTYPTNNNDASDRSPIKTTSIFSGNKAAHPPEGTPGNIAVLA
jgi:hypothetical protein